MSTHHFSARALVAIALVPLSTLLACASRNAEDPSPTPANYSKDTTSTASSDGKTIENLFEGRFPGVTVSRANNGGLQIRIRGGSNSFYGSNEPLYIVDDTPLPPGSDGVIFLNPYDIQKIEVLKNPADIGVYGIRGANGVIKISTKKPKGH
ncbi:MAG: TonB-dependent receptor plug domain-containing protein [Thermoanaerobaculia bacterium]